MTDWSSQRAEIEQLTSPPDANGLLIGWLQACLARIDELEAALRPFTEWNPMELGYWDDKIAEARRLLGMKNDG